MFNIVAREMDPGNDVDVTPRYHINISSNARKTPLWFAPGKRIPGSRDSLTCSREETTGGR